MKDILQDLEKILIEAEEEEINNYCPSKMTTEKLVLNIMLSQKKALNKYMINRLSEHITQYKDKLLIYKWKNG